MNNRLYVANISFNSTENDLRNHFASVGTVSDLRILNDRDTGRSRGFGFVTMSTPEEASRAINSLNDQDFNGRRLFVSVARERDTGSSSGFNNNRGASDFQNRSFRPSNPSNPSNPGGTGSGFGSRQTRDLEVNYRQGRQFDGFSGTLDSTPTSDASGFGRRPDRGVRRARSKVNHYESGE